MPFHAQRFQFIDDTDKEHCRPFDRTRAGLNLGEGAGYLVLQSDKSLTKAPYCELSGYANANEAYHQTGSSPDGDRPFLSMSQAIASAGLTAGAIDYINVHGTGTPSNDASEGKPSGVSSIPVFRLSVRSRLSSVTPWEPRKE